MKRFLVMNGPNLNLLGRREPQVYGALSLERINARIAEEAAKLGVSVTFFQSNHEGALVDKLHETMDQVDGVILNAGAYTHTSVAIADAIKGTGHRVIEVHLSNIHRREEFRHHSFLAPVCEGSVVGLGWKSYVAALQTLAMDDMAD